VTDPTHAREQSPLEAAVARVGDRWTLLVVEALLMGPLRFNDLSERVRGIAPNILTSRLRGLERDGVVLAHPYSSRPPRFVYELTDSGRELACSLRLLTEWGARRSQHSEPLRHEACGTALEVRWYCPTCERSIEEGEATDVDYV
jgi:DNA-binding HxlR family transcriptional regulator